MHGKNDTYCIMASVLLVHILKMACGDEAWIFRNIKNIILHIRIVFLLQGGTVLSPYDLNFEILKNVKNDLHMPQIKGNTPYIYM